MQNHILSACVTWSWLRPRVTGCGWQLCSKRECLPESTPSSRGTDRHPHTHGAESPTVCTCDLRGGDRLRWLLTQLRGQWLKGETLVTSPTFQGWPDGCLSVTLTYSGCPCPQHVNQPAQFSTCVFPMWENPSYHVEKFVSDSSWPNS